MLRCCAVRCGGGCVVRDVSSDRSAIAAESREEEKVEMNVSDSSRSLAAAAAAAVAILQSAI